ncbi:hypothetical protein BOS5A_150005 [Bosea sp. EC-HK365B]|nr:hypothetical protein BOSE46_100029 [Bosea sp. 46]CAD5257010.1 hypothetical protein BOSE21B_110032 [Bosea sp. 21B]CAD5284045.1 hypothetical protein BOSE7B_41184 [Bosea sp. 7B]VVT56397.1 hypothetical protein BOS5A_150005 [Bosea sp. EC-HK365B]VXB34246.1 hypothetical protein BOSE29B_100141 [Bosea sp. 29B]VXB77769.1 hypothetical protein BOSE125_150143 [Bosea sp. 125]VXC90730.1 hypothetical protein BOSE127_70228 [Bosea sp. 127]
MNVTRERLTISSIFSQSQKLAKFTSLTSTASKIFTLGSLARYFNIVGRERSCAFQIA